MRIYVLFVCMAGLSQSAWSQDVPASPAPGVPPESRQPASGALPDDVISLRNLASGHYYSGNYPQFVQVLEKLTGLRPFNGEYMYQLAIAYALAEQPTKAYNQMLIMQQQGLSYDFTKTDDAKNIRETQVFEYLSDLMIRAGEPMGSGSVLFHLPDDFILPEAIDWDADREKFVIGNVREGRILLVSRAGEVEPFIKTDPIKGPWSVFDLKIDSSRNLLWVSSSAGSLYEHASVQNIGKSGLFKFDLKSGKLLDTYLVTDTEKVRSAVANIALASDGTVFVADSLRPVIYKLGPGEDVLAPAFASPLLVSIRGMALSEDDKTLYLADYELGVVILKLEENRALSLGLPDHLNMGGIDGIYSWGNHLVAIQNGNSPERVIRLELDSTGTQVVNVRPLEVAHPAFDAPNYGTVVGDDLYYFANSQWHKIDSNGALADKNPVSVMKTSLHGGADLRSPEMERIMEQIQQQQTAPSARPGLQDPVPDKNEG